MSLETRQRMLIVGALGIAGVALGAAALPGLTSLRARVAAHERELAEVRRAAGALRRVAIAPPAAAETGSLLVRLQTAADGVVGRDRIASMTPTPGPIEDGLAEERVALAVHGTSLTETVRLLHALETGTPPLHVARLALRKHPDDAERFDATIEVAELRAVP